jgi:predicted amidohydrolase YtcJ
METAFAYIGTHTGFGNEWLQISGLKILGDGIPPSRTGYMWDEYLPLPDGSPGGFGSLLVAGATEEERYDTLINMIKYANAHGFQVGIHATGDRAIDACVDGYIEALEEHPWDARHYIIHTDYVRPETANRMAPYGILANVQSTIKWTIGNLMVGIVGPEKAAYQWPLRMMIDHGLIVTNSSDASVTYPDWRQGVESAVLREDKATGEVSGPEQRITVEEAIRTYTINGAWQDHQEVIKGSIEPGKLADFCIIGGDILSVDPHDISDIPILMTIVGGEVVYNADPGYLFLK